MKNHFKKLFHFVNPEAAIWICGLIFLAFINTDSSSHFTICPLKNIGIDFCPGCGLGKSIHYLLHLQIENSLNAHPLGIFAFAVLLRRISELIRNTIAYNKKLFLTTREHRYDQSFTVNA